MTGLIYGDPNDVATLNASGVDAIETSPASVLGATAATAWSGNPAVRIFEAQQRGQLQWQDEAAGTPWAPETPTETEPRLDPEDATKRFGIKGQLKFEAPVTEAVAKDLHDAKLRDIARQDVIERRASSVFTGTIARGGVGLAVGLLDPLNIGAGFIPVVGEARVAGMIAGAAGAAARVGIRAGVGAAQGAVAMAALEPVNMLLDSQEQNDWHMSEALRNIAFGGLIGGGLHVLLAHPRAPLTGRLEALTPEDRAALLQAGIAQHTGDATVNVAPVLDTAELRTAFADRLRARGDTAIGNYTAYTPEGMRVELRPEVVELDSLIPSHQPDGTVNPAFPHEAGTQPRDRTSAASQAQVTELASRLEPERLGPSPEASTGAPIVSPEHVVESGNGRIMALHKVHTDPALTDQAAAYRTMLEARGHDLSGMRMPVLIGRRVTALAPEETRAFVRGANERATLGMNAAEQARLDAGRAGKAAPAYAPGPIGGRDNQAFVSAFMAQIPAEERAGMILANGQLSTQGEARIRMALLAHAYGDALGPTLERMLNGDVDGMKHAAGALTDVAGAWSQMRAAAAAAEIPAGLDITPSIGEALQLLDRAHTTGTPIATLLDQADMLNRPTPAAEALLRLMFRDDGMRMPVARAKLSEILDRYIEQAMQAKPGAGLFGDAETSAADILRTIAGDNPRVAAVADALAEAAGPHGAELPEQTAASQGATEAAAAAGKDHVGAGATAEPAEASLFSDEVTKPEGVRPEQTSAGETFGPGDLWRLNPEQLEAMLAEKTLSDDEKLVRALGEDGARRFKRLQRASESSDTTRADAAGDELLKWESTFTPEQSRLVYGIGESEASAADIEAVLKAHRGIGPDQTDTAYEAALALRKTTPADLRSVPGGHASAQSQAAFVTLGHAIEDMRAAGIPDSQIPATIAQALMDRGGWSAGDAGEIVGAYFETLKATAPRGGEPIGKPLEITDQRAEPPPRELSPELREMQALMDREAAAIEGEMGAGRLTEADLAPLRAADAGMELAETRATAAEAAASCLIATGELL